MRILLLLVICINLSATAQTTGDGTISLSVKNAPLEEVFKEIRKQSGYAFVYTREQLQKTLPVSIQLKDVSLQQALDALFTGQPFTYILEGNHIAIREKPITTAPSPQLRNEVTGVVRDEEGQTLGAATVAVKGSLIATATNEKGEYHLKTQASNAILVISAVGFRTKEVPLLGRTVVDVVLTVMVSELDKTVIIAYGSTTRRLSTGSIEKLTAQEIAKQPVSNPLAALQGRIPGLLITQSSGMAGAGFSVQLRGQNSIIQGSEPLFIIDGVPFSSGNSPINQLSNAAGPAGLSPLHLLNPSDIESIEVLKDADATAIYGSRGANGVILITTKKGKAGTTRVTVNVYRGWSKVTRTMDMLNTSQYVGMRREAFANDGVVPNPTNAPDLLLWDTTQYTDLRKLLIGGTAHTLDAQLSFSGGNAGTQYRVGGGYRKETTVFPTDLGDQKASLQFNLHHTSANQKLSLTLSGNYLADKNRLHFGDPTRYLVLPPHIQLRDSLGKINWVQNGVAFSSIGFGENSNPLANLASLYTGKFHHLLSNLQLNAKVTSSLSVRINLGYNTLSSDESQLNPSSSLDPTLGMLPYSYFGTAFSKSWILEPQVHYQKKWKDNKLEVLLGATIQQREQSSLTVHAGDYSNDLNLPSIAGAGTVNTNNGYSQYRYTALFGRLNYNYRDEYLLNITGRRDGSSRFGPRSRFSNFGAFGAAWIFSKNRLLRNPFSFLSFGKVRASYGITGNDQIGDYRFLDTWTASSQTYQGIGSLNPTTLFNPDYAWEVNKKLEAAIELGFFADRFVFSAAYFRNHSGNQIVQYSLPIQTGFSSVGKNLAASIRNWGWEFSAQTRNFTGKFSWTSNLNLSITRNKLLDFPGLATSSYSTTYTIGAPLSARKVYQYLGIGADGVYQFNDVNKDGKMDRADREVLVNPAPSFYGGIQNNLSYGGFECTLFLELKKQSGFNYLRNLNSLPPGTMRNQPLIALERWQAPGDQTTIQKFTTTVGRPAYTASVSHIGNSDAIYGDASFVRVKNISLSYQLNPKWLKPLHFSEGRIYLQAQNLFTITGYQGADPENQNFFVLPPLKTFAAGVHFSL
ncbi:MAG TPA: SusC/RagA family TonB-linked outer membrane protein [Flavisolibacter sp.]|nr:SusC/RagA family TonB-linked outer membrane protein [Flavisolibacter sp.]